MTVPVEKEGARVTDVKADEPLGTHVLELEIAEVIDETADARSLVFTSPADTPVAPEKLRYDPGQFLTLRVPSDLTGSVARCYSLCSSPFTGDPMTVTVKRTADGYASNWLCDHAQAGMKVHVLAPSGTFVPKSPLVSFGAVLRPKVDRGLARPVTGGPQERGASVIPAALTDQESYYTASFRRAAPGQAAPVALSDVPPGEGVAVSRPDLVELVPLEGAGNRGALDETAQTIAEALFKRPERVEAAKYSVARPWPVNCDGVVSGVEIALRPNGKGFVTTIHTGAASEVLDPLGRGTRPRVPRGQPSDAAAREGLSP